MSGSINFNPQKAEPSRPTPWLGLALSPRKLNANRSYQDALSSSGVLVYKVVRGSPSESAGVRSGDLILKVDGIEVDSVDEVIEACRRKLVGESINFLLRREDCQWSVDLTCGNELRQYP